MYAAEKDKKHLLLFYLLTLIHNIEDMKKRQIYFVNSNTEIYKQTSVPQISV